MSGNQGLNRNDSEMPGERARGIPEICPWRRSPGSRLEILNVVQSRGHIVTRTYFEM